MSPASIINMFQEILEERVNVQVAQVNEMNNFPSSAVCVLYTL